MVRGRKKLRGSHSFHLSDGNIEGIKVPHVIRMPPQSSDSSLMQRKKNGKMRERKERGGG